jgi:hypothetical protein
VVEELSRDDVVQCVDRAVEELLTQARVKAPPVDAIALTRHVGLPTAEKPRQGHAPRANRSPPTTDTTPCAATSEEQRQWEAAQAIGKHLQPQLLQQLGFVSGEKKPPMGESLSGLFARHLLLPSAWFSADAASFDFELFQLKERYRSATHEMIAFRLLDLPEPCIITLVVDDKVHRRRSNAWPVKKRLEPAEAECLRAVTRDGQPHTLRAGGWTVWGWPLWHGGCNREVLRSVVEVDS